MNIEATVSNTMPVSLLLSTGNPELPELLEGRITGDALAVMTRTQSQKNVKDDRWLPQRLEYSLIALMRWKIISKLK